MSFKRQVLSTLLYRGSSFVLGIWVSILTYRGLGTEARGLLTYLVFLLGLITAFADLGVSASAVYLLGAKLVTLRELKRAIQTMAICMAAICMAAAYYYFWIHMDAEASAAYSGVRSILLFTIPLAVFARLWESVIYAENKITVMNRSTASTQWITGVLLTVAWLVERLNLRAVFAVMVVAHLLQSSYLLWMSRPIMQLGCAWSDLRKLLTKGFSGYVGALANYGNYRISYYFITNALGASALAIFSLGTLLSEKILDVTNAASIVLLPQVAHGNKDDASKERAERIGSAAFFLTLVICAFTAILAPVVLHRIYGHAYSDSAICLLLLLPGTLALAVGKMASVTLAGEGRIWSTSWPVIVTLPVTAGAFYFVLPKFGLFAAAILTSANFVLITILLVWIYCVTYSRSVTGLLIPRKDDLMGLMQSIRRRLAA